VLDRRFFKILVKDLPMQYRKNIFDEAGGGSGAKDVHSRPYPQRYSEEYLKAKRGRKLNRQHDKFAGSFAPVATGDLFRDFRADASGLLSDGMGFGFVTDMGKVKSLARSGREISTKKQPLPKPVIDWIMEEADKYTRKEWRKDTNIKGWK
tara:strand:- start:69 stop:521 length:453 start_codon:yes stop_codon:yes gene_type:complete